VCCAGVWAVLAFNGQLAPLLLERLGVPRPWLLPALSISQVTEVACLGLLPLLLRRLGLRGTLLLGVSAAAALVTAFTLGRPAGLVLAALGCNGLCISCFVVAGQVFTNGQAGAEIRASAQGLVGFLNGLGLLAGNVLAGWVRERVGGDLRLTFLAAVLVAVPLVLLFLVGFHGRAAQADLAEALASEAA
jgi:hypothetical protein